MPILRSLLVHLLCALLACAGAPGLRAGRTCQDRGQVGHQEGRPDGSPGCCVPVACPCCSTNEARPCDCGTGRDPLPELPAPKPVQVLALDFATPLPQPPSALPPRHPVLPEPPPRAHVPGALPHRSRQEALSVWRC